jgi:hypothetical protein
VPFSWRSPSLASARPWRFERSCGSPSSPEYPSS